MAPTLDNLGQILDNPTGARDLGQNPLLSGVESRFRQYPSIVDTTLDKSWTNQLPPGRLGRAAPGASSAGASLSTIGGRRA